MIYRIGQWLRLWPGGRGVVTDATLMILLASGR